jgi:hypothetical protein
MSRTRFASNFASTAKLWATGAGNESLERRATWGHAMDMFNYVMVLASVIIGLGITHLLTGVAAIVQHPGREKVYWVHLLWVAAVFLRAIFWWWFEFRLSQTPQWTFTLYVFVLLYAFLIYLWCALLFPRDLGGYDGFKDYFYSRRAWFFGVALATQAIDIADTLLKGMAHFRSLGPSYPLLILFVSALMAVAMRTRNERFHAAFALFSVIYLVAYPWWVFDRVG